MNWKFWKKPVAPLQKIEAPKLNFKVVKKKVKVPIHSWRVVIQENNYEHEVSLKSNIQPGHVPVCLFTGREFSCWTEERNIKYYLTAVEVPPDLSSFYLTAVQNFYTFKLQDVTLTLPKEAIKGIRIFNKVPCGEEEVEIEEVVPV